MSFCFCVFTEFFKNKIFQKESLGQILRTFFFSSRHFDWSLSWGVKIYSGNVESTSWTALLLLQEYENPEKSWVVFIVWTEKEAVLMTVIYFFNLELFNTYWPPQFILKPQVCVALMNDSLLCNWGSCTESLILEKLLR